MTKSYSQLPLVSFFSLLLFCLYFLFVPILDILPWFNCYDEKRILELLLLLTISFLHICVPVSRNNWLSILKFFPVSSKILLLLVVIFGLVSSVGSQFPKFAFLELSLFVLLFAISLCVANCRLQLDIVLFNKMIAIALFLTGWVYLLGFLGNYITAASGDTAFNQRALFGAFSNIRFFSQFQSWTISLVVIPLLLFKNRPFFLSTVFIAVAITWWLLLFTSGTRGTLVGCFIAIPLVTLIIGKDAKNWFQWQLIAITGGMAAYCIFFFLIPAIISIDIQSVLNNTVNRDITHLNDRMDLWSTAVKMVQSMPWFGAGPMHYAAAENTRFIAHPHNSLLQIAAEWGLPVTLAVIFLFVWGVFAWVKTVKSNHTTKDDKNIYAALLASLITGTIHSLFSGIIVMPLSQIMLILVIGWMLGIWLSYKIDRAKVIIYSRLEQMVLCGALLAVCLGVIGPLFPEVLFLEKLQIAFLRSHPEEKLCNPRFWLMGNLNSNLFLIAPKIEDEQLEQM